MPLTRDWVARATRRTIGAIVVAALPVACGGSGPTLSEDTPPSEQATATATPRQPLPRARETGPGAYLAGRHAQQQRDFGSAAEFYGRALSEDPNNVELLRRSYALLAAEGDIDTAVGMVHRLLALKEDSPVAAVVLSVKEARADNFAKVEKLLEAVPRHGLNSFIIPLMTAWAQVGQGRIDAALQTVGTLARTDHLAALYHFHSGLINDLADRREAAAEQYQATVDEDGGLSLRAVQVVGSFHLRHGNPEKARALYDRYQREHPETVLLDGLLKGLDGGQPTPRPVASARDGLAETLFGAATTVREGNAIDSSLLFARLALAVQPDFPLAQVLVGDILQSQGRYGEANKAFQNIDPNAPVYYSIQLRIADNLKRMSESGGAIRVLEALAEKRPDRADALVDLGDVLRGEKRFTEAVAAYDKAMTRVKSVEPRHWALFYSRGIALERSQQWQKAEKDFLRALELQPEQPYVLNYLGYSWLEQKVNVDKAKAMIRRAVEQRPEDGYIVDSLGWALYQTGDYEGSVREIERAVELQPDDSVINDHLGDAYWRVGRRNEARFQWNRALSLNPEADTIAPIRAKLDRGLDAAAAGK
ncbi:MAG: tetratricopeptide repeat protein [Alphaproteobacteria bacterium]